MREIIQTPLFIGSLGIIIASIFWVFIYFQKLNSAVGGISHASLAGIWLGYMIWIVPVYWAYLLAPFLWFLLAFIAQKHRHSHDALISLIWSMGMSLGILFLYLSPWYTTGLNSYLFGNILFTGTSDLIVLGVLSVVTLIFFVLFHKVLLLTTYDQEFAKIQKLPVNFVYYSFMILVAFIIVALTKIIGIVLILALFSLPTMSSLNWKKSLKGIIFSNIMIGLFAIWGGIIASYYLNIPSSPIIIWILVCIYFLGLVFKEK